LTNVATGWAFAFGDPFIPLVSIRILQEEKKQDELDGPKAIMEYGGIFTARHGGY